MIRFIATTALLLATTALASAQSLDAEINRFIEADGFERVDVSLLEKVLLDEWVDNGEISPGGSVGPLEKALIIATAEIPSTRTRTALSYGEMVDEEYGPVSFIEVRHYNLGPSIRKQVIADYGEGDVADAEAFGLGDHMAWRFIFQPLMGSSAALMDASSMVIPEKAASKADCMGRPCLDPFVGFDETGEWEEIPGNLPVWPELYAKEAEEVATPAHAVAELAVLGFWANAESGSYQWTGGEHPESIGDATPYRFIGIDRQLGQDTSIDVVWRETEVMDDALSAVLFRRVDVAGSVYLMRAGENRD